LPLDEVILLDFEELKKLNVKSLVILGQEKLLADIPK
jgi:hypothetical protein